MSKSESNTTSESWCYFCDGEGANILESTSLSEISAHYRNLLAENDGSCGVPYNEHKVREILQSMSLLPFCLSGNMAIFRVNALKSRSGPVGRQARILITKWDKLDECQQSLSIEHIRHVESENLSLDSSSSEKDKGKEKEKAKEEEKQRKKGNQGEQENRGEQEITGEQEETKGEREELETEEPKDQEDPHFSYHLRYISKNWSYPYRLTNEQQEAEEGEEKEEEKENQGEQEVAVEQEEEEEKGEREEIETEEQGKEQNKREGEQEEEDDEEEEEEEDESDESSSYSYANFDSDASIYSPSDDDYWWGDGV